MRKLSRKKSHRTSLIRNLATSLILYESMETTLSKAKEVKGFVDTMLGKVKTDDLNTTKYLSSVLFDNNAIKKSLKELLPRYKSRTSGFVVVFKSGHRLGDSAATARVELIDKKTFTTEPAITKKAVSKKVEKIST